MMEGMDPRAVEFVLRLSGLKSATSESNVIVFTTVDGATYAKLKVLSALTGTDVPSIIRNAVEAYLQRKEVKEILDSYFLVLSAEEIGGGCGGLALRGADKSAAGHNPMLGALRMFILFLHGKKGGGNYKSCSHSACSIRCSDVRGAYGRSVDCFHFKYVA